MTQVSFGEILKLTKLIPIMQQRYDFLQKIHYETMEKDFKEAKTEHEKQTIMDSWHEIPESDRFEHQTLSLLISTFWKGNFSDCLLCFSELYKATGNKVYLIETTKH